MAIKPATTITSDNTGSGGFVDRIQWTLNQGDSGAPTMTPTFSDRAVQFEGVFGGATVTLKGSLTGNGYENLTDPQGNDITKTSPDLEAVSENPFFIAPFVTGGDVTTAIIVTLQSRRNTHA